MARHELWARSQAPEDGRRMPVRALPVRAPPVLEVRLERSRHHEIRDPER